jgi:outer membrane protein W
MRTIFAAVMLLGAVSASAGDIRLSVLTNNLSYTNSKGNVSVDGGGGLAISKEWSPNLVTELSVSMEKYRTTFAVFDEVLADGQLHTLAVNRSFRTIPIDFTTQYQFNNDSRWTPYIVGGLRYVSLQGTGPMAVPPGATPFPSSTPLESRTSAEVGLGTRFRFTDHAGARVDVMRLLRTDGVYYDHLTRVSLGLTWKF